MNEGESTGERPRGAHRALRAALLSLFALYVLVGPFVNQVIFTAPFRALPAWRMFGTRALGECQSEFLLRAPDGSTTRLDRYALLDVDRFRAPNDVRHLKGRVDAERLGARLCDALRTSHDDPDVRLHRRCADLTRGWNVTAQGEVNLCAARADAASPVAPTRPNVRRARPLADARVTEGTP